jgi:hypothetical protein
MVTFCEGCEDGVDDPCLPTRHYFVTTEDGNVLLVRYCDTCAELCAAGEADVRNPVLAYPNQGR